MHLAAACFSVSRVDPIAAAQSALIAASIGISDYRLDWRPDTRGGGMVHVSSASGHVEVALVAIGSDGTVLWVADRRNA